MTPDKARDVLDREFGPERIDAVLGRILAGSGLRKVDPKRLEEIQEDLRARGREWEAQRQ